MLGSSTPKHHFPIPPMEQCKLIFWLHMDRHFYTTTPHFLLNLLVFGLPKSHWHFYIYRFRSVSTNSHFASSDSPHFTLRCILNRIDLHIRITVTMCVGEVNPSSVGQSASNTSWYMTHTILIYSLRSINVNLTTVISTQRPSYALSDPPIYSATLISAEQPSLWYHHHEFQRDGPQVFQTWPEKFLPLW